MDEPRSIAPAPQELYPQDPIATLASQEPRSLSVPAEQPGTPQSVGVGVADIPSRLVGGDGIAVEVSGLDYLVRMDIAPLQVDAGDPRQQWVPVWTEGHPFDATYRVPVAAIPADAPKDHIVYGRQDGSWVPAIENVTISWDDIQGVPGNIAYLPIAQADVTMLVEDQDFQDAAIAANTTKNTEQDGRLDAVETKNTSQDTAIAGKEPTIAPGTTSQFWRGDKSWQPLSSITVDAYTKAQSDAKYEPIIATGNPAYFWAGDKTWKATAPFPEAPTTGLVYGRRGQDASWQTILAGATLSDTPPSSPVAGQFWVETDTGGFFTYWADADSSQWVQLNAFPSLNGYAKTTDLAGYLPLVGGQLSGNLALAGVHPALVLNKPASGQQACIYGDTNGLLRWRMDFGDSIAEAGSNAGSNFALHRWDDAGAYLGTPIGITRSTGVIALTGATTITSAAGAGLTVTGPGYAIQATSAGHAVFGKSTTAANGGVLGYTQNDTYYGILGHGNAWGVYSSGPARITGALTCDSTLTVNGAIGNIAVSNFLMCYNNAANITTGTGQFELMFGGLAKFRYTPTYECPVVDNAIYTGLSSNRWYQVYAVTGTIQTSDEREKHDIRSLSDMEKTAAQAIKQLIVAYRWRPEAISSAAPAGEADRYYIGVIAQRVEEALRDAGLDPNAYSMWRRDELTRWVEPETDAEGKIVVEGHDEPTGEHRYSVDYNQILAFIIGGM